MASAGVDPLRRLAVALVVFLTLAGIGCTHPCLQLAEKLCECEANVLDRENCKRIMKSAYDRTRADDLKASAETCGEQEKVCDCEVVATEDGKKACGLARP